MRTLRPPTPSEHERGRKIEDGLLRYLSDLRDNGDINTFGQSDAFYLRHGKFYLVEAKAQSLYLAPPFDGHGLRVDQAIRYRLVWEAAKIRTLLIVWDDTTCWMQWIDVLESGQWHDTPGSKTGPRRVYPLSSFDEYPQLARYGRKAG